MQHVCAILPRNRISIELVSVVRHSCRFSVLGQALLEERESTYHLLRVIYADGAST